MIIKAPFYTATVHVRSGGVIVCDACGHTATTWIGRSGMDAHIEKHISETVKTVSGKK